MLRDAWAETASEPASNAVAMRHVRILTGGPHLDGKWEQPAVRPPARCCWRQPADGRVRLKPAKRFDINQRIGHVQAQTGNTIWLEAAERGRPRVQLRYNTVTLPAEIADAGRWAADGSGIAWVLAGLRIQLARANTAGDITGTDILLIRSLSGFMVVACLATAMTAMCCWGGGSVADMIKMFCRRLILDRVIYSALMIAFIRCCWSLYQPGRPGCGLALMTRPVWRSRGANLRAGWATNTAAGGAPAPARAGFAREREAHRPPPRHQRAARALLRARGLLLLLDRRWGAIEPAWGSSCSWANTCMMAIAVLRRP